MFMNSIDLLNPDIIDHDELYTSLRPYFGLFVCLYRLKKYGYSIFSDKILNKEEQKRYFSYAIQLNTEREAFLINTQSLKNLKNSDGFLLKSFDMFDSFFYTIGTKKDNLLSTNVFDNESLVLTYEIPIRLDEISFDALCSILIPKKNNKYILYFGKLREYEVGVIPKKNKDYTLFFDKSKKYEVEANENKIIYLENYIQTVLKQNIIIHIVIKKENLDEWANLKIKMQVLLYDTSIRNLIIKEMIQKYI